MIYFSLKGELDQKTGNDGAMLVVGVGTVLLGIYYAYSQITKSKTIFIDIEKVLIDKRLFYQEQIENIFLTKKKDISIFSLNQGAIIFKLKDGSEFTLYDSLYRNAREMKIFLEIHYGLIVDGRRHTLSELILPDSFETFYSYKGNLLISYRFYLLVFWFVLLLKGLVVITYFGFLYGLAFGSLILLFIIFMYRHFNYFQLSEQSLIVANHIFFWHSRQYKLAEIRNVIFEQNLRGPKCLRIIQNDFKEVVFAAATLNKLDWIELKKNLEKVNIQVSVERVN